MPSGVRARPYGVLNNALVPTPLAEPVWLFVDPAIAENSPRTDVGSGVGTGVGDSVGWGVGTTVGWGVGS